MKGAITRRNSGTRGSLKPPLNLEKYKRGHRQGGHDSSSAKDGNVTEDSVNPNNISHDTQLTEPETDIEASPARPVRSTRKNYGRQQSSGSRRNQQRQQKHKNYSSDSSSSGQSYGGGYGSSTSGSSSASIHTAQVSQEGEEVQFVEFSSLDLPQSAVFVHQPQPSAVSKERPSEEAIQTVSVVQETAITGTTKPPQDLQEQLTTEKQKVDPDEEILEAAMEDILEVEDVKVAPKQPDTPQYPMEPPTEDLAAMSIEDATECDNDDLVSCSSSVARLVRRFERDSILKAALLDPPTDRSVTASAVGPEDVTTVDLRRYATKVLEHGPETAIMATAAAASGATVPEVEAVFLPRDQGFPEVEAVFQLEEFRSTESVDAKPAARKDPPEYIKAKSMSSDEDSRMLSLDPSCEMEKPEPSGKLYRHPRAVGKISSTPSPLGSRSSSSPGSMALNPFGMGLHTIDQFGYPVSSVKFGTNPYHPYHPYPPHLAYPSYGRPGMMQSNGQFADPGNFYDSYMPPHAHGAHNGPNSAGPNSAGPNSAGPNSAGPHNFHFGVPNNDFKPPPQKPTEGSLGMYPANTMNSAASVSALQPNIRWRDQQEPNQNQTTLSDTRVFKADEVSASPPHVRRLTRTDQQPPIDNDATLQSQEQEVHPAYPGGSPERHLVNEKVDSDGFIQPVTATVPNMAESTPDRGCCDFITTPSPRCVVEEAAITARETATATAAATATPSPKEKADDEDSPEKITETNVEKSAGCEKEEVEAHKAEDQEAAATPPEVAEDKAGDWLQSHMEWVAASAPCFPKPKPKPTPPCEIKVIQQSVSVDGLSMESNTPASPMKFSASLMNMKKYMGFTSPTDTQEVPSKSNGVDETAEIKEENKDETLEEMLSRRLTMAATFISTNSLSNPLCSAGEVFAVPEPNKRDCMAPTSYDALDNCCDKKTEDHDAEKEGKLAAVNARRRQFEDHDYESFGDKSGNKQTGYSESLFGSKRKDDPFSDLASRKARRLQDLTFGQPGIAAADIPVRGMRGRGMTRSASGFGGADRLGSL